LENGSINKEYKSHVNPIGYREIYDIYMNYDTLATERVMRENEQERKSICYPDHELSINRCQISMTAIFSESHISNIELKSNSKHPIKIQEIIKSNPDSAFVGVRKVSVA
jgi:hypothetical protein